MRVYSIISYYRFLILCDVMFCSAVFVWYITDWHTDIRYTIYIFLWKTVWTRLVLVAQFWGNALTLDPEQWSLVGTISERICDAFRHHLALIRGSTGNDVVARRISLPTILRQCVLGEQEPIIGVLKTDRIAFEQARRMDLNCRTTPLFLENLPVFLL